MPLYHTNSNINFNLSYQNGATTSQGSRNSSTSKDPSRSGAKGPKPVPANPVPRATIEINSANFPPLQNSHSTSEDGPVPVPGYQGTFIKYSFDDIINIVKDIKDPSLPASIKPVRLVLVAYLFLLCTCVSYLLFF